MNEISRGRVSEDAEALKPQDYNWPQATPQPKIVSGSKRIQFRKS